jgi:acetylornithine deacetylase/succinyl-diaminopimelate desuccinylase-like protein
LRPGLDATEAQRRLFFEPTCNVCGMTVGYGGPGIKTIVPNRAVARLDFRLPLGLTPDYVEEQLRAHLQASGFGDIEVRRQGALSPSRTAPDALIVQAVRQAVATVYGLEPVLQPTMYASGPMFELCQSQNIPAVTFGAGHPGDNVHGIDENIVLDDYFQAMRGFGEILRRFGEA